MYCLNQWNSANKRPGDHVRTTRVCCLEDGASPTEDSPAQEASPVSQQAPALRSRLEPARPLLGRCERRRCARVGAALHLVLMLGAALPLVLIVGASFSLKSSQ